MQTLALHLVLLPRLALQVNTFPVDPAGYARKDSFALEALLNRQNAL